MSSRIAIIRYFLRIFYVRYIVLTCFFSAALLSAIILWYNVGTTIQGVDTMAGKICPILSAGGPDGKLQDCIGTDCMLYLSTTGSGSCVLVKSPQQLASRMDTLSAQIQEIQVVMNEISNAQ